MSKESRGFQKIQSCRISGSKNLVKVLSLGEQVLTGVFPRQKEQAITEGPLELVWCPDSGLLQLNHSYDLEEMYGLNYGYRSGLNESMISHLSRKVWDLIRIRPLFAGDVVLDIGSNDGTLLRAYNVSGIQRLGIDPTGSKFSHFYKDGLELIPDFFSSEVYKAKYSKNKPAIITSISMFYDLESPNEFVSDIAEILHDDGIWHFEQSYMPAMLRTTAYDTVCHEHLEYYSLAVVKELVEKNNLRVVDVNMNGVNGGSFAVTVVHRRSNIKSNSAVIEWVLGQEERMGLHTPKPYREFEDRVFRHRDDLVRLIKTLNTDGKTVVGYGASTKGNVLLQFCGFDDTDIQCIAEVNKDKFGCYTPGTLIPILPEDDVKKMKPDYMIVLPWHFKEGIMRREQEYLASGGKLIFPLPEIEII
jgi:SAM-dependent methyltransferase